METPCGSRATVGDRVLAELSGVYVDARCDEADLLAAVAASLSRGLGAGCLILLIGAGGALELRALSPLGAALTKRLSDPALYADVDLGKGAWRELYAERRPVVHRVRRSGAPAGVTPRQAAMLDELAVSHLLAVPLVGQQGVFGCVVLARRRRRPFTEKQTEVVRTVADRTASAVERVRAWERERRARLRAEAAEARLEGELTAVNTELEAYIYSISHDLRAPLRAIDGFSQAVAEDYAAILPEQGQSFLQRIRAAAARMGGLIDALLSLSRTTSGSLRPEPVDLGVVCREIVAELANAAPGRVVDVVYPGSTDVWADPRLLRTALRHLLQNAWNFTRNTEHPRIEVSAEAESGGTSFTVKDNGVGFDPTHADRLFQPFQRLHRVEALEGAGIGLAVVRRIVNRHGGRVWAEGQPDAGAAFHVWLPGAPAAD